MPSRLFLLALLAFGTALLAFRVKKWSNSSPVRSGYSVKKAITRCSPDWQDILASIEETEIPPIAGAGNYKWRISTNNDSAQFYFNQGINMYYSFHIIEAMASFKKAARFDPSCAMLEWAQALAYGPNINDIGYAASPEALAATRKAISLSGTASDREKMLIQAMNLRYSADSTQTREKLNQLYVDKLKEAWIKYPDNADVAVLYADAMMLQHPWDLWTNDGKPRPWTPLIRTVLEKVLSKTPGHPGANHYYIHVMEPSPYAEKALASADRLGKLTPGLSHTVHMPSHIYLRTGNYSKGIAVNEEAIRSYKKVIPIYAPVTGADFLYIIHNAHMQTNQAMLAGKKSYSVQSALETVNSIPKDYLAMPGALGNYIQYIYMTPVLVDIRFSRWEELLKRERPAPSMVYANILHHFGRGMASANLANLKDARMELDFIRHLMKDSSLAIPLSPFSAAIEGAIIAENMLLGSIALADNDFTNATAAFGKAVQTEEKMVYNEPRDWLLNPKQYLGFAYIKARQWKEALETFNRDLSINRDNGWALWGLYQALTGLKEKSKAESVKRKYLAVFVNGE